MSGFCSSLKGFLGVRKRPRTLLKERAGTGWQRKRKTGAFSRLAFDGYLATVSLHHLLDDSQAQPGAAGCAGPGGVRAIEALEEVREMFGRNANPAILHAYFDHRFAETGGGSDLFMVGGMHYGSDLYVSLQDVGPILVRFV